MSNINVKEIENLVKIISKLPGLGPKSAKRIILKLINNKENMIKPLAKSLANVYKNIVRCGDCGNLKVINDKCIFLSLASPTSNCWEPPNMRQQFFNSK